MSGAVRVLWLTKGLGWGGAERLLAACARYASRERYEIEVAYVLPWKDGLVPELAVAGIRVHCLGGPGPRAAWPLRLRRLLTERDYAIVHTHAPVPAVAARIIGPRSSRLVHTEHNTWPRYRRPTRWANALTYGRNDAAIAVSKAVAGTIAPPRWAAGTPVTVVIHGIEHTDVHRSRAEARERLGLSPDAFVIGTVGNLTAKKDQRTLLDATRLLTDEGHLQSNLLGEGALPLRGFAATAPSVSSAVLSPGAPSPRLVIVGTGPLERELRTHASSIGLANTVLFAGLRQDVTEILPAFDVFVLSSRYEGLPVALIEAMAAGVPVVATEVGGIPEIVNNGIEGLLVPPGDPGALATALSDLAGDGQLRDRLVSAAGERARTLDVAVAQRQIEDVYAAVLAAR